MSLEEENHSEPELGGQMSFMEHLDELRRRLMYSIVIIAVGFGICWTFRQEIYNFLAIPVQLALAQAQQRDLPVEGLTGSEKVLPLSNLQEGDAGRYVFEKSTRLGATLVSPGTSVSAVAARDNAGNLALFTSEAIYTANAIIPKGIKLPIDLGAAAGSGKSAEERLMVTTAMEPFTLYVTVSLYGAVALSMPFLLFQVWGFVSPALYRHERSYVTPFILLSSISFVVGAAFAYYVLFPTAVRYLLGLGEEDFRLMLRATDYFDFITLIMLAMGIIFQMPAVTYVLARIGIVSAGMLIRSWKIAIVVILIVAAVVSPTADALNMMLFAAPMMILYLISIFVAWFFGRKRTASEV